VPLYPGVKILSLRQNFCTLLYVLLFQEMCAKMSFQICIRYIYMRLCIYPKPGFDAWLLQYKSIRSLLISTVQILCFFITKNMRYLWKE